MHPKCSLPPWDTQKNSPLPMTKISSVQKFSKNMKNENIGKILTKYKIAPPGRRTKFFAHPPSFWSCPIVRVTRFCLSSLSLPPPGPGIVKLPLSSQTTVIILSEFRNHLGKWQGLRPGGPDIFIRGGVNFLCPHPARGLKFSDPPPCRRQNYFCPPLS